jgi:hypothetical protein
MLPGHEAVVRYDPVTGTERVGAGEMQELTSSLATPAYI